MRKNPPRTKRYIFLSIARKFNTYFLIYKKEYRTDWNMERGVRGMLMHGIHALSVRGCFVCMCAISVWLCMYLCLMNGTNEEWKMERNVLRTKYGKMKIAIKKKSITHSIVVKV